MSEQDSLSAKIAGLERLAADTSTTPGERDAAAGAAARLRAQLPPEAPPGQFEATHCWTFTAEEWRPYQEVMAERRRAEKQARGARRAQRALKVSSKLKAAGRK